MVGYLWRGKHVVRAYRREINYPNTERQQDEREWFVSMVRFAATARQALLLGLREKASQMQMTEGNVFVKMNKSHFGRGAALCTPTEYERICIAEGGAAPVRFTRVCISKNSVLAVDFERNSGMTRAKGMLTACFIAAVVFFVLWLLLSPTLHNNALWLAFVAFLATRGLVQTIEAL